MNNSPMTAEDLTLYAMHLLEPDEAARVEELLLRSPEARHELAEVRGDLALFALATEQQTPSAAARQRLLKEVAREPRFSATREPLRQPGMAAQPDTAKLPDAVKQAEAVQSLDPARRPDPAAEANPFRRPEPIPQQTPFAHPEPVRRQDLPAQPQPVRSTELPAMPEHAFAQDLFIPSGQAAASSIPAETPKSTPVVFRSVADEDREPKRGFFSLLFPWTGWAVAAALGVAAFNLYQHSDNLTERLAVQTAATQRAKTSSARAQEVLDTLRSGEARRFTLTKTAAPPEAEARVTYLASTGSLVFQGSHLDALPADKTYELWLIPAAAGAKPIPAGLFKPDERGEASVILPELPKGVVAGKFGITMEEEGGSGTPTAPILLAGQ